LNEVRRMRDERGPAAPALCGRAERRQLALLFCDLADSVGHLGWVTALDSDLDDRQPGAAASIAGGEGERRSACPFDDAGIGEIAVSQAEVFDAKVRSTKGEIQ
jgi:hypothetical protein